MSSIWKNKYRQTTQTWSEKTSAFITSDDTVDINPFNADIDPDFLTNYNLLFVGPHTNYPNLVYVKTDGVMKCTNEVRRVLMKVKGMSII